MKKILILISILLLIASCGKSDEELLGLTPKDEEVMIEDNTVQDNTVQDNPQSNTGSISGIGAIQEENKEEVKEEKKVTNNKELVMINHNVFLREPGKEDEVLTTRAKGLSECEEKIIYSYEILSSKGNYGVVKRLEQQCEIAPSNQYYIINLSNRSKDDTILTDITSQLGKEMLSGYRSMIEIELKEKSLLSKIINNDAIVDREENSHLGTLSAEILNRNGYRLEGDYWEKKVDFTKILPNKTN